MGSGLLRQRRNLLIISSALIVFDFAQLTVVKINLLGTELLIGKPEVLMVAAWVLWGYFFLRYYQYMREEKDLKIISTILHRFEGLAVAHTKLKSFNAEIDQENRSYYLKKVGFLRWDYVLNDYNPGEGKVRDISSKKVSLGHVAVWLLRSVLHVTVMTPRVTEYIAPIVVAIIAPVVSIL
ncbi:hypothetical protein [Mariprofundus sp. KV]|uniref:hypothetical protein n=1 Tax=Mariprofundus sp. KV TaxID=2608715 RepID=UPI0015A2C252|nr:hypothetical protein [Mariprofundus sp. KV]NWF37461.1 hypothetical protein [Mariprofundus sp. KV]